jgi:hypothetical protein
MIDAHIVVAPSTIRAGGIGPATGNIWIVLGPQPFPSKDWNDFVVVILEAWVGAIVRLLHGASSHERVYFMDGPYFVDVLRPSGGALRLRAIEGSGHEMARTDTEVLPFIENLLAASEQVLAACRDRDCWSADAEQLSMSLRALRMEAERLRN